MKHKFKPSKFTKHRGVDSLDVRAICDADQTTYTALVKLLAREVHNDLAHASQKILETVDFREGTSRPSSED